MMRAGAAVVKHNLAEMRRSMDFPTNGGHPVKGVKSPWEVQYGKNTTHLHP
jgi:hypothetical protein